MTTLTRDEQRALRAWGSSDLLSALAWPTTYEPSLGGCSSSTRGLFPEGCWIEFDTKAVAVGPLDGPPVVKVTWPRIYRYARSLPSGLVERIRAHTRRNHRLALQGHRIFTLGPGYGYMRSGADRDLPEYDRETWESLRDGLEPLQRRAYWLLIEERNRLLDEALPLAVDDEPADLLELLETIS